VGNILAPHRKACQCLFPILPQCDTFLIIVFPMYFIALLRRARTNGQKMQKAHIAGPFCI
jgi:hypothetical protein